MTKPIVAIVGRQNVGKSTLLNRLAGKRIAIVDGLPGTTRDRIMAEVSVPGHEFTIVDTGGLELSPDSTVAQGINEQVAVAITEAEAIIFLVDVRDGLVPTDLEIADRLRKTSKPVVLVANKADNAKYEAGMVEFYELGLGEPVAISAYHGRGIPELLDRLTLLLPAPSLPSAAPEADVRLPLTKTVASLPLNCVAAIRDMSSPTGVSVPASSAPNVSIRHRLD